VQQRTVSLPPVLTITAQVLLGVLVGGFGIVLATPLVAVVFVLVRELYVKDTLGDALTDEAADTNKET
jgi:predicted PurR-regulated permease PerM